jgi:hypothetical protein
MVKSTLAVHPEDPGSIPSTHIMGLTPVPGDLTPSYRDTCRQNTNVHKVKIYKKKKKSTCQCNEVVVRPR